MSYATTPRMKASPWPVLEIATTLSRAYTPAPTIGESPTRPSAWPTIPPVEVAAATRPAAARGAEPPEFVRGVPAAPDDRRVPDPPVGLADHPAGGGSGGDASVGVAGDRADRSVAGGGRPAGKHPPHPLPPWPGGG